MRLGPCQPGGICRAPTSPTANRSPSLSPHQCRRPLRRSARAELMREAREIRGRTRKVGKPTQTPASQAQRSAMREIAKGSSPAWGCWKGPARGCPKGAEPLERISYWNRQIFCVNWGCFISPQGSHALCNDKIVARLGGSSRRRHEDVSFCFGRAAAIRCC
jgi:hypothetical protein